ncbi:uncharacterized protein UV8b_00597 [Ustilaginoidea virens]|uniref:Uncharacterized protein n=1 Tax=Ustilaginoidea virens TaxID=1159556 RepID=A0A8E5MEH4_USTVR|nr:uncharacterized protein UV8b_00597 [Ustilaginoidea virens]QUC16356.1 hypothetical protein UV8b_00597 [Ustilaginoidea virens]
MSSGPGWVAAVLTCFYGLAAAKPLLGGYRRAVNATATLKLQPVWILTEIPIAIQTYFAASTELTICDGLTISITRPSAVSTVLTITRTRSTTISSASSRAVLAVSSTITITITIIIVITAITVITSFRQLANPNRHRHQQRRRYRPRHRFSNKHGRFGQRYFFVSSTAWHQHSCRPELQQCGKLC